VIEASPELRTFSMNVLDELEGWVKALAAKNATGFHGSPIVAAANALRDGVDPDAEPVKAKPFSPEATQVLAPTPAPAPARPSPEDAFEPAPEEEAGDTEILDDFEVTGPGELAAAGDKAARATEEPAFT